MLRVMRRYALVVFATFDVNPTANDVCLARGLHSVAAGGLLVAAMVVQGTLGWSVPVSTALGAMVVMET